jgi:hypothetical protein
MMLMPTDLIHSLNPSDILSSPSLHSSHLVLAQMFQQDILGDLIKGFNTFVKTGRLWAMLIGFVIGYVFKSMTSYGG